MRTGVRIMRAPGNWQDSVGGTVDMEKATERTKIDEALDKLCEEYLHMVRVFAESLLNEQK